MPPAEQPSTIAGVLARMDAILEESEVESSRLGYFAALYRRVTRAVKDDIAAGMFEDGPRMERLDVIFASRYLDAYTTWQSSGEPTVAWRVAFEAAESWRPIVLQHLLVGMNAHILLDLGIAAARTSPGDALPALRNDFNQINSVLASLVDKVQAELAEIWPALAWIDRVGGRTEETVINFSMEVARDFAWKVATELAPLDEAAQEARIEALDAEVAALGRRIVHPGWLISSAALFVRVTERGTVRSKIGRLAGAD